VILHHRIGERSAVSVGVLALFVLALAGCGDTASQTTNPGPSPSHRPSATEAGSFSHCQKVTGAWLFQIEHLPFTAAYRRGIDGACRAADPTANVAAVAEVAKQIARGETP
jgi:hypothetical protein